MKAINALFLLSILCFFEALAQEEIETFEFRKGEVMDITLLNQHKKPEKLVQKYKETTLPVAVEFSYESQSSFKISDFTMGEAMPEAFVLGKWSSIAHKKSFLNTIVKRVPNFHKKLKKLFPYYKQSYYKFNEDTKFSINSTKYNVVTAMWNKNSEDGISFFNDWLTSIKNAKGKVIVTLGKGMSPENYTYAPNVLCIVEWKDKESFKNFTKKHPRYTYKLLKNVQQFRIR